MVDRRSTGSIEADRVYGGIRKVHENVRHVCNVLDEAASIFCQGPCNQDLSRYLRRYDVAISTDTIFPLFD